MLASFRRPARTPSSLRPAPRLGEHTEQVCRALRGLDAAHFAVLAAEPDLLY